MPPRLAFEALRGPLHRLAERLANPPQDMAHTSYRVVLRGLLTHRICALPVEPLALEPGAPPPLLLQAGIRPQP